MTEEQALLLIPEGKYPARITAFESITQSKTSKFWFMKIRCAVEGWDGPVFTYAFGTMPTLHMLMQAQDFYKSLPCKIEIKHTDIGDSVYYNARLEWEPPKSN